MTQEKKMAIEVDWRPASASASLPDPIFKVPQLRVRKKEVDNRPPHTLGLRGLGRVRVLRIHAFQSAITWFCLIMPLMLGLVVGLMTREISVALVATSFAMAFSCLIGATVTDLMSMRIPNPLSLLSFLPAFLLWGGLYLGFEMPPIEAYGRAIYAPFQPLVGTGAIVPEFWSGTLFREIVMSFAGAILIFIPLLLSYIINAMGGGDAKLMPPIALFFGWSLAFDFLFLTFFFGGIFAIPMLLVRKVCRMRAASGSKNVTVLRIAQMKTFAYAPAIAASGLVCFAAKWQGFFG